MNHALSSSCRTVRLALLQEGETGLNAADRAHLRACGACRTELAALACTELVLRAALRPVPLSAAATAKLQHSLDQVRVVRPRRLSLRVGWLAVGGAAAGLLVSLLGTPVQPDAVVAPVLSAHEWSLLAEALREADSSGARGSESGAVDDFEHRDEAVRLPWSSADDWDVPLPARGAADFMGAGHWVMRPASPDRDSVCG